MLQESTDSRLVLDNLAARSQAEGTEIFAGWTKGQRSGMRNHFV